MHERQWRERVHAFSDAYEKQKSDTQDITSDMQRQYRVSRQPGGRGRELGRRGAEGFLFVTMYLRRSSWKGVRCGRTYGVPSCPSGAC